MYEFFFWLGIVSGAGFVLWVGYCIAVMIAFGRMDK